MTRTTSIPDDHHDLPPSAKLVYTVLDYADEPLTQQEIRERSALTGRTARYALERLEERGLIESRPSVTDARQQLYKPSPSP
ncbi:MarR family transcriptional regulator [Halobaculum sp. EA56]|uniref:MarR family transcriptional regulator n=1 Tax=Halobaculum sp. EA56 TaxID=3421648 RepID=UPI003EC092A7